METIQIVLPLATLDHIRAAVPGQGEEAPTVGVTLEKPHATALFDALKGPLGALSPQPAELAGQAVAAMVEGNDRGALERHVKHALAELKLMGG